MKPDRELLSQGFPAKNVVMIHSGLVKLVHAYPDGRSAIIGLRGRLSVIGIGSALLAAPQPLAVITVTTCALSFVPADEFALMVRQDETLAWQVHLQCARELHQEFARAASLACLSARERLASYLAMLRAESPPHDDIRLPLRDWELAQLLAVTPQYLSRLMQEVAAQGQVQRSGKSWLLSCASAGARNDAPFSATS